MEHVTSAGESSYTQAAINRGLNERYIAATEDVERLMQAAYRIIEREGSVDLKIRPLLAEAGISSQQFYRYFASKDDFFVVLLEDGQQRLHSYLQHCVAKHTSLDARIEAFIHGCLAQAEDPAASSRARPFLVHRARLNQERARLGQNVSSGALQLLTREVESAQAATGIRDRDAESGAQWVLTLVFAVMEQHILDGTSPTPKEKKSLVAFCFNALGL